MKRIRRIITTACLVIAFLIVVSCEKEEKRAESSAKDKPAASPGRLYEFEMVFIKDSAAYLQYTQKLRGLAVMRNGHLERTLNVDMMWSKDAVQPDVVNIVYFDSARAKSIVESDSQFLALAPLRDSALLSVSISGASIEGNVVSGKVAGRAYLIEFVQYLNGDSSAYTDYVAFSTEVMKRYGYHLERVIKPTSSDGIATPDLIRVMYFENPQRLAELQKDAEFSEVLKRYQESVEKSLWIMGKTPPPLGAVDRIMGG